MKLIPDGDDGDTRGVGKRVREGEPDPDKRVHPGVTTGGNPEKEMVAQPSLGFRLQCNL